MKNLFLIDGYYKDDKSEFTNYLVSEYDDAPLDCDDDVFFYGLSENDIIDAIKSGEDTALEFVITGYKPYKTEGRF
jgi:hypothetical protein